MPTATMIRTDREIQTDVLAELRWDYGIQANEIGVAVKDGVVTLTGTVDTYLKKWKAEEAAHRVNGVVAVANDINVRTLGERTDADIAAAAVHALKWNSSVPADKIQVTVDKGWVTLKGEVEWQYQKLEAERAVRGLWGEGREQPDRRKTGRFPKRLEEEDRGRADPHRAGGCQQHYR